MTRIIGGQEAEVNEWPWQVVFVKSGMVMIIIVKVMTMMRRRVEISIPVRKKTVFEQHCSTFLYIHSHTGAL